MGCLHFQRATGGAIADGGTPKGRKGKQVPQTAAAADVLVTQTHSVRDAGAAALARWLQQVCERGGVGAFYEEGLSCSATLAGQRRRRLKDAFEASRCVAAAVVGGALAKAERPPLTNEILWAEQHNKPIVLLYDSAQPFSREDWKAEWPFLFQQDDLVVRYYGKGHATCGEDLLKVVHRALGGDESEAAPLSQQRRAEDVAKQFGEDDDLESVGELPPFKADVTLDAVKDALLVLRATQQAVAPELELPVAAKSSILRGAAAASAPGRRRNSGPGFRPTERRVQEAVGSVTVYFQLHEADVSLELALDCLRSGIAVNEHVTSTALRALAVLLSRDDAPAADKESAIEVVDWALAALRRHSDSVDVCTSALEVLAAARRLLGGWLTIKDTGLVAGTLRDYPGCQALQRQGFALFAHALADMLAPDLAQDKQESGGVVLNLRGGGLARVLTRLDVGEFALVALSRHPGDQELAVDVCAVLQVLATASREVKLLLVSQRAVQVWIVLASREEPGSSSVVAALRLLASLASEDPEVKRTLGSRGLLDALESRCLRRIGSDGSAAVGSAPRGGEEAAEVFGFLCRLTARNAENKRQCLKTRLPQCAAHCCLDYQAPAEARLAAGGFLVNLGSEGAAAASAPEASLLLRAAAALRETASSNHDLGRCGLALEQLLGDREALVVVETPSGAPGSHGAAAAPESPSSAFDGIFAYRRGSAAGAGGASSSRPQGSGAAPAAPPKPSRRPVPRADDLMWETLEEASAAVIGRASGADNGKPGRYHRSKDMARGQAGRSGEAEGRRGPGFRRLPRNVGVATRGPSEANDVDDGTGSDEEAEENEDDADELEMPLGAASSGPPQAQAALRMGDLSPGAELDEEGTRLTLEEDEWLPPPPAVGSRTRPSKGQGSLKGTATVRAQLAEVRKEAALEEASRRKASRSLFGGRREAPAAAAARERDAFVSQLAMMEASAPGTGGARAVPDESS